MSKKKCEICKEYRVVKAILLFIVGFLTILFMAIMSIFLYNELSEDKGTITITEMELMNGIIPSDPNEEFKIIFTIKNTNKFGVSIKLEDHIYSDCIEHISKSEKRTLFIPSNEEKSYYLAYKLKDKLTPYCYMNKPTVGVFLYEPESTKLYAFNHLKFKMGEEIK